MMGCPAIPVGGVCSRTREIIRVMGPTWWRPSERRRNREPGCRGHCRFLLLWEIMICTVDCSDQQEIPALLLHHVPPVDVSQFFSLYNARGRVYAAVLA